MSASLVGSEMCIRDRAELRRRWHADRSDGRTDTSWNLRWMVSHDTRSACLLYTSDAADDM
eukprot:7617296-Alexandrium_andersonii.AAC.1